MKVCNKCNVKKELSKFQFEKNIKKHRNACKACRSIQKTKNRLNNIDLYKAKEKANYYKNQEKYIEYSKKYFQDNKQSVYKYQKEYRKNNPDIYRLSKNYQEAKRRAIKKNATLPGYDNEIKDIYYNCPKGYHVDHIIPLNNPNICGLHVPWNLQYLTARENIIKSNKLLDEYIL